MTAECHGRRGCLPRPRFQFGRPASSGQLSSKANQTSPPASRLNSLKLVMERDTGSPAKPPLPMRVGGVPDVGRLAVGLAAQEHVTPWRRPHALAESLVRGAPQHAAASPGAEFDLGDEHGVGRDDPLLLHLRCRRRRARRPRHRPGGGAPDRPRDTAYGS